jgi:hypothetical protein
VETDEASSLNEEPGLRCESSPGQPASTSSAGRGLFCDELDVVTGREAEGDASRFSAAWACTPSEPAGNWGERVGEADCSRLWRQLNERTTSPLQIGHVLRRVTSQGVLRKLNSISVKKWGFGTYMQSA